MRLARLRTPLFGLLVLAATWAPAFAQAPTTGSIYGAVIDNAPKVLPGVTVTITGPAMMGEQATVTNEKGNFRFPSLPIGAYRLVFSFPGLETVTRDGISVHLNAAASVYVQMKPLAETAAAASQSGQRLDTRDTNVQHNVTAEASKNMPNARDLWALIGVSPGTTVTRFDVGGSAAGTQTGYSAAGINDQVRVQIDGVNATEGTSGTGYFNYGAFAEVQVGTASNDASMPSPGAQTNAVLKTGGNDLKGDLYFDYENKSLQGRNVTDALVGKGVGEGQRLTKYYDLNFMLGGAIKKDRLWYFVSARSQQISTFITGFPVEKPGIFVFDTKLAWATEKLNLQLTPNNRLSHYFEFRGKWQPSRGAASTLYSDAVYKQDSLSPYGNFEWERVVSPSFFFNARVGTWGYNWANYAYGPDNALKKDIQARRYESQTGNEAGGYPADRNYRRRWQFDWSGILFKENWAGASHTVKMAYLAEWEMYMKQISGHKDAVRLQFNSPAGAGDFTTPYRIQIYNTPFDMKNTLWHHGAYMQDQIMLGPRLSVSAGVRWDYYSNSYPDEVIREGPYRDFFYAGAPLLNGYTVPASFPSFKVPGQKGVVFKAAFAPRLAVAWDPQGNGKTALKFNWGRYYYNIGPRDDINPIQSTNYTFRWNDLNGDRQFQMNELGTFVSSSGGAYNTVDPNLHHPYTTDASVWVERQILSTLSGRMVFIYRKSRHQFQKIEIARLGSLYTYPVQQFDPGPDGLVGTSDDRGAFTSWDIPPGVTIPASRTMLQTPDAYNTDVKSIDVTFNRRMSQRWSLVVTFLYNWSHLLYGNGSGGIPQNPNDAVNNEEHITDRALKLYGSYRAPYGIVVSPVLRYQGGTPMRRAVQLTNLRTASFDFTVEPFGTYRSDDIWLFDVKAEKRFQLLRNQELGVFFDAFNIANSYASQSQDAITGRRTATLPSGEIVTYDRFLRPLVILSPRIFRLGVKFSF